MQKQKLDAHYFLAIQATYDGIELGLCKDGQVLKSMSLHKFDTSRLLIITIDHLLCQHALKISHLSFIAVNQGPGPFTTLRTVLATVNGIAFAAGIPLVGVDGLAAFLAEVRTNECTLVMLNAFNKDVYFAIGHGNDIAEFGCMPGEQLLVQMAPRFADMRVACVGNAVSLWRAQLEAQFGDLLQISDPIPQTVSIAQVTQMAYGQWQQSGSGVSQLMPLYLKQYSTILGM